MSQQMSQAPVIGEDQQTLSVHVETTHGKDPHGTLHELQDGRAPLRIRGRRHHAVRFVQEEIDRVLRGRSQGPIDTDHLYVGIDTVAEFGHSSVDGHATLTDEDFASSTRTETSSSQSLLQAFAVVQLRDLGAFVDVEPHLFDQLIRHFDRRHELLDRRKAIERGQSHPVEEELGRAVQNGLARSAGPAYLFDVLTLLEQSRDAVDVHAAKGGDLRTRYWLSVSNDREGLEGRRTQSVRHV